MASSVVEPIEEALSSISGIDELTSGRITEGTANITVKFVLERDINDAANDVREKVRARWAACRRSCCRRSSPRSIPIPIRS